MLVELTTEANEESFVIILQHGGNDVTCKSSICSAFFNFILENVYLENLNLIFAYQFSTGVSVPPPLRGCFPGSSNLIDQEVQF